MIQKIEAKHWEDFKIINANRRAIRDFDGSAIPEEHIREMINEAILAPSSGGAQPYEFHWIKDVKLKSQVAKACNGQRSAATSSTLIVMVTSTGIAKKTIAEFSNYIEGAKDLNERSRDYNRKTIDTMKKFFGFAPLVLLTPLLNLFSLLLPVISLLPFGGIGVRQWTAKNSIFAAQNLLLAAVARGYDACPMEGFNAIKIASLLKLPYGSVIPVVIAIGKRAADAPVESRWRKSIDKTLIIH